MNNYFEENDRNTSLVHSISESESDQLSDHSETNEQVVTHDPPKRGHYDSQRGRKISSTKKQRMNRNKTHRMDSLDDEIAAQQYVNNNSIEVEATTTISPHKLRLQYMLQFPELTTTGSSSSSRCTSPVLHEQENLEYPLSPYDVLQLLNDHLNDMDELCKLRKKIHSKQYK